jgi:hypothetical protein
VGVVLLVIALVVNTAQLTMTGTLRQKKD